MYTRKCPLSLINLSNKQRQQKQERKLVWQKRKLSLTQKKNKTYK